MVYVTKGNTYGEALSSGYLYVYIYCAPYVNSRFLLTYKKEAYNLIVFTSDKAITIHGVRSKRQNLTKDGEGSKWETNNA